MFPFFFLDFTLRGMSFVLECDLYAAVKACVTPMPPSCEDPEQRHNSGGGIRLFFGHYSTKYTLHAWDIILRQIIFEK
jgi:hypothetical protein